MKQEGMMGSNAPQEQFQLRVKAGSRLERVLDIARDGSWITQEQTIEAAGGVRGTWNRLHNITKWFDNLALDFGKDARGNIVRISYVAPRTQSVVQHIHQAEFSGVDTAPVESNDVAGELIWPDSPGFMDTMDNFDEPEYFSAMKAIVESGRHISLSGPPGIGKSTSVEQLAAQEHKILINIGCEGGLSKRDLVGSPEIVNGTSKFLVAEYAAAVVNGWWVKIDEVNAADADALLFINGQMAPPYVINIHGKQYKVHKDFRLFVTYNRGLAGTKPLPPAFKDRFFPVFLEFPSAYRLRRLLERNGMPPIPESDDGLVITMGASFGTHWTDAIVNFGCAMWDAHVDGRMRYQISPRRLMDAAFLMTSGTCDDVTKALDMAVLATIDIELDRRVAKEILSNV